MIQTSSAVVKEAFGLTLILFTVLYPKPGCCCSFTRGGLPHLTFLCHRNHPPPTPPCIILPYFQYLPAVVLSLKQQCHSGVAVVFSCAASGEMLTRKASKLEFEKEALFNGKALIIVKPPTVNLLICLSLGTYWSLSTGRLPCIGRNPLGHISNLRYLNGWHKTRTRLGFFCWLRGSPVRLGCSPVTDRRVRTYGCLRVRPYLKNCSRLYCSPLTSSSVCWYWGLGNLK